MSIYRDPVVRTLIEKFENEGPRELNGKYYWGDPVVVNPSYLPAVFISKEDTKIRAADNMTDEHEIKLQINLSLDLRKDWNTSLDSIGSHNLAYDYLEGRDDNGDLKSTALAYICRKYQVLNEGRTWISLRDDLEIDYVIGAGIRGEDVYTLEAMLRLTLIHHQAKP